MDVYLGRQITDYGKNPDSLVNDVLSRTPGDKPVTIITYDSRIDSSPELKRLFRNNTVTCSGPFSMITCKPESQGTSDLRNLSD